MKKRNKNSAQALTAFHVMAKPVGPICNLDCRYCFYLEKENLYGKKQDWAMPDRVLESYVSQFITAHDTPAISFAWQGGEPTLLGVDFFRKVVAIQNKYANGKKIENAFQTNGVLLDDRWGEFLAENHFLIGISIDGTAELHDFYRVDKGGAPTFDRVMRGLRFLKGIGCQFMQFIPIVERMAQAANPDGLVLISPRDPHAAEVSEWSVEPRQYGVFLCAIFDEWVRKDVGDYYVQLFDVTLESWMGLQPSLCVFRPTCGAALALEHNGDLYSCDHYVYPENKLGNILEQPLQVLVNSPQQRSFGLDKRDSLPRYCRECDVRFACNGECPKHRFISTPDGEPGLNYLCAGYKLFFQHVDPYMKFMANELRHQRPPANVMSWIHQQEHSAALVTGS